MIYVITGQTATGKTARALELAEQHNGELINCDSRQIYKQLDIITGKDLSLTTRIFTYWKTISSFDIGYYSLEGNERLWLYDIISPHFIFSAFEYRSLAVEVIRDIEKRGKTPIIVGGTYFYLQHLLYDILDQPIPANPTLRAELEQHSTEMLQKMIIIEAPDTFATLNNSEKHNRQRLIRKIEVIRAGSIVQPPKSEEYTYVLPFSAESVLIEGYHFENREKLTIVIRQRIQARLTAGAIGEVENLLKAGYTGLEPGLQTIGYIQIINYLKKELSYEEMIHEWTTREIQYAKRQYTFAKRDPNISWIEV
ncbi:tRNA (adenosine(37)-N6)-dimethylallyltransferase MiaA [soil metagenome]